MEQMVGYGKNYNIEVARILACMGVVGLHGIGMSDYTLYYFCSFSVPMFFMINGYLMFSKEKVDYSYSFKKISAYARLIVCWNLIIMIPVMVLKHKFVNPIEEILKSLVQKGYLWHFWYFGAMIVTLLLLPAVHGLLRNRRRLHIVMVGILFLICLGVTYKSWHDEYPNQAFVPQTFRIWVFGFYFLVGALFGVCSKDQKSDKDHEGSIEGKKPLSFKVIVLAAAFLILTYVSNMGQKHLGNYAYHNRIADNFYDEGTVMLWCVAFFAMLLSIKVVIPYKVLDLAGRLTLGIFIIHPLVLKASETFIRQDMTYGAVLRWALAILVSGAATWVMLKIPYIKKLVEL